jgi:uncharacterized membrane protein
MASSTPTVPPPTPANLSSALKRNIKALEERRAQEAAAATSEERVAEAITSFTGSMMFVYLHLSVFGAWILINLGILPILPPFDSSFVILAMIASVEAIFLSTFVLISQNRMAKAAEKQSSLDLQINLLTEHELTRLVGMVEALTAHFNIQPISHPEIEEIKKDVAPEAVLDAIEAQQDQS